MERSDTNTAALHELGDFLRAKRRQIRPEDRGLTSTRRRSVPGLSRDETATLADIGASWYARLEAGRVDRPTLSTMRAVTRALELNGAETNYALKLAGLLPPDEMGSGDDRTLSPALAALFEDDDLVSISLWDRYVSPVAWNALADGMFGFSDYRDAVARHPIVQLDEERMIAFLGDAHDAYARSLVGMFRRAYAASEPTPFAEAVYTVGKTIPVFRQLWKQHVVAAQPAAMGIPFTRYHWIVGEYRAVSTDLRTSDDFGFVRIVTPADDASRATFALLRSIGRQSGAPKTEAFAVHAHA